MIAAPDVVTEEAEMTEMTGAVVSGVGVGMGVGVGIGVGVGVGVELPIGVFMSVCISDWERERLYILTSSISPGKYSPYSEAPIWREPDELESRPETGAEAATIPFL